MTQPPETSIRASIIFGLATFAIITAAIISLRYIAGDIEQSAQIAPITQCQSTAVTSR